MFHAMNYIWKSSKGKTFCFAYFIIVTAICLFNILSHMLLCIISMVLVVYVQYLWNARVKGHKTQRPVAQLYVSHCMISQWRNHNNRFVTIVHKLFH